MRRWLDRVTDFQERMLCLLLQTDFRHGDGIRCSLPYFGRTHPECLVHYGQSMAEAHGHYSFDSAGSSVRYRLNILGIVLDFYSSSGCKTILAALEISEHGSNVIKDLSWKITTVADGMECISILQRTWQPRLIFPS